MSAGCVAGIPGSEEVTMDDYIESLNAARNHAAREAGRLCARSKRMPPGVERMEAWSRSRYWLGCAWGVQASISAYRDRQLTALNFWRAFR